MFQNIFQIENLEIENFSRVILFSWDSVIFYQNSVLIHRNRRSIQFRARLSNYRLQPSSECILKTPKIYGAPLQKYLCL